MSIDHLLKEKRLSLVALAKRENVSKSTAWRWAVVGVRGIRLECYARGGMRFTTEQAWKRFQVATSAIGKATQPEVAAEEMAAAE